MPGILLILASTMDLYKFQVSSISCAGISVRIFLFDCLTVVGFAVTFV